MLLDKALDWAQELTEISSQERDIIMDAKSALLYRSTLVQKESTQLL